MPDDDVTTIPALANLALAYDTVALVANSEAATPVPSVPGKRVLHVFFNDARKVLSDRFDDDAVLVLRSGRSGPSVIRQGKLGSITDRFGATRLKAVINLRVDPSESPTDLASHAGMPITQLDLSHYFTSRYPGNKLPSSGYAMAVWLAEAAAGRRIVLSGFDSLRSENWKVFHVHDWAFEQTALRLLERKGILHSEPPKQSPPSVADAFRAQFPTVPVSEVLAIQAEVLSERLEHTNEFVDRLWSVTRLSRLARKILHLGR